MKYLILLVSFLIVLTGCGTENNSESSPSTADVASVVEKAKELDSAGKSEEALQLIDDSDVMMHGEYAAYYLDLLTRVEGTGLMITEHSFKQDDLYMYIDATLTNGSKKHEFSYVKVKVTYYDKDKNVLNTDWTYAIDGMPLKPDESRTFKLMTDRVSGVKSYTLEIQD
ncbi:FxLYD domain-containing protein [Paenibacillus xylaniclasticus]|uniref:FxLYD domain-containing protein n=1 Tax=Paenibacillus xylaniclasticus TaxID=588083 RepID=UPI000FD915EA|nr:MULTISPECIES: FxLYD domain-containing protein [Paenibacillus]GFN32607.1 hypothetical protein PCURB6_28670 [Paenibacillus curdlanolyticus]